MSCKLQVASYKVKELRFSDEIHYVILNKVKNLSFNHGHHLIIVICGSDN